MKNIIRFFIEIKSYKEAIVPKVKEMIETYNMYDRVSFITFTANQLANLNKYFPEATGGLLCNGILDDTNSQEDMLTVMKTIGKYNATLNPDKSGYGSTAIQAALSRGIAVYPWTFNSTKEYDMYFMNGYSGLTGNDCRKLGNYAKTINVKKTGFVTYTDRNLDISFDVKQYGKNVIKSNSSNVIVKFLDDGVNATISNNQINIKEPGIYKAIIGYESETANGDKYVIYSDVTNIEFREPLPAENDYYTGGIGIAALIIVGGIGVLTGLGFLTFYLINKRKKIK